MNSYKHYIITRFNLRVEGWDTTKNRETVLTNEWLNNRLVLFQTYCLPSVNCQVTKNFTWLIFLDIQTPKEFRHKIEVLAQPYEYIKLFYIDGSKELVAKSGDFILKDAKNYEFIITTRLDNDDLLHKDFISTVQKFFNPVDKTIIDICDGYQLSIEKEAFDAREYHHPYNAFISFIEKRTENIETIFSRQHYDWKDYRTIIVDSKRMWIELVHDRNKVNSTLKYNKILQDFDNESFCIPSAEFTSRSYFNILLYNYITRFYFLIKFKFSQYVYNHPNIHVFLQKIKQCCYSIIKGK